MIYGRKIDVNQMLVNWMTLLIGDHCELDLILIQPIRGMQIERLPSHADGRRHTLVRCTDQQFRLGEGNIFALIPIVCPFMTIYLSRHWIRGIFKNNMPAICLFQSVDAPTSHRLSRKWQYRSQLTLMYKMRENVRDFGLLLLLILISILHINLHRSQDIGH